MSRARKVTGSEQGPDPSLAAELRQGAGREWVEEAAEDERLTELLRRRRLELKDVIAEMAARGERVTVDFGGHNFSGIIAGTGDDYATIEGAGQVTDVRLEVATWSRLVAGPPAESRLRDVQTFRALLNEYSGSGTRLRLALPDGQVVIGDISVVAIDHVELQDVDGRLLYIPMPLILAVIRSTDFH